MGSQLLMLEFMSEERADYKTRFKKQGIGSKSKQPPICAIFPADVDKILRDLPNRSEYIRDAVINQMRKDGLID
ncbi:hypothetical protein B4U84_27950 [Westiellopsis prolifica IICB1]|nr:hypothetical protein B4U84_27950 [Westiellopsis prolifica IICB1]